MKALYLIGPKKFEIRETPAPSPGAGEVAVAIKCVGLCGSDRHYMQEDYPHDFARAPMIPGHEGSGEIVGIGAGVVGLKVGDHVAIEPASPCRRCETCYSGKGNTCPDVAFMGYPPNDGLMREIVAVPAVNVEKDESGKLSYADLMMLEPLAIAVTAMDVIGFRTGWTATVVGCGCIGLTFIATLKAMGATEIFATDVLDYKRVWALRYGADHFLNPRNSDVGAEIYRATGGRGVDVAFECAGDLSGQNQALSTLRPSGSLGLVGINHEEKVLLDASLMRRRAITAHYMRRSNETLQRAIRLAAKKDMRLGEMVTHTFPFAETPKAFDEFLAYANGVVKVCVSM
jgi:L-iditol 2-dehydrogenase